MRAVREQNSTVIAFNKGVDQTGDPRLSAPGTFELVQNMRIRGGGVMEKRPGSRAIGSRNLANVEPDFCETDSTDKPSFIATAGDLGMIGNSSGAIFAHNDIGDGLIPVGRFSSCLPIRRRSSLVASAYGQSSALVGFGDSPATTAVNSDGYIMVAATDDEDEIYAFIESPDGARIYTKKSVSSNASRLKVVAQGSLFILSWVQGTSLIAQTFTITLTTGSVTASAETTLDSPLISGSYYDVYPVSSSMWCSVHQLGDAPAILVCGTFNGLTLLNARNIDTGLSVPGIQVPSSIYSNGTNVWVGWVSGNDAVFSVLLASDMSVVRAATTLYTDTGIPGPPLFGEGNTVARAFALVATSDGNTVGRIGATTGSPSTFTTLYDVKPISKPDPQTRAWFMSAMSVINEPDISRVFLARLFPPESGFTVELSRDEMPDILPGGPPVAHFFDNPAILDGRAYFTAPFILVETSTGPFVRFDVLEYSTAELEPHRSVARANSSLFIAGQPVECLALPLGFTEITGEINTNRNYSFGAAELGFIFGPSMSASVGAAGTGGLQPGVYIYYALFEWVDQRGQRHQSQPSQPLTVTVTAIGCSITITHSVCVTSQRVSSCGPTSGPYVVFYRTVADGTSAHRLPEASPGTTGSYTGGDAADSTIETSEILYTQGNVLANTLAPSCRFMRYASGRLWCGGLWETDTLEASKIIVPNEQPAFTNDATHRVSVGGSCTGLAVMDDQLVVFREDAILTVVGDGPNDQGVNGQFFVRTVSSGIGCIDERSIAETDIGVFFRSRLGIFLLPRGFGPPQYIGAAVRSTADDFETTLGAAVWHGNGQHLVKILVTDDVTSRALNYEINTGQWFIDTFEDQMAEVGVWPEGFVLCTDNIASEVGANNPVWIEDADEVADAVTGSFTGFHIEQRFKTNWVLPFGPGGWGDAGQTIFGMLAASAASVTLQFEADSSGAAHSSTFSLSSSSDVHYRYLVPAERHGVAFRLSAWDGEVASEPAAGVKFLAATMETSPDGGIRPADTGERV